MLVVFDQQGWLANLSAVQCSLQISQDMSRRG